jgi:Holliday junction DNA helicase RuvA
MIERLVGRCIARTSNGVVIDVNGVGYGVEMPEPALLRLAEGETTTLWTHTHVREDALRLFGFLTVFERQIFLLLLGVSGIGPKVAMATLSGIDAAALVLAIEQDDEKAIASVPGIGAGKAKKIILELKAKIEKLRTAGLLTMPAGYAAPAAEARGGAVAAKEGGHRLTEATLKDLAGALQNFGYKDKEFGALLKRWERGAPATTLPDLLRLALADLTGAARAATPTSAAAPSAATRPDPEELF